MSIPRTRRYPMRPIKPRTIYNITIAGSSMTPAAIVAAIKDYEHRNGTEWLD